MRRRPDIFDEVIAVDALIYSNVNLGDLNRILCTNLVACCQHQMRIKFAGNTIHTEARSQIFAIAHTSTHTHQAEDNEAARFVWTECSKIKS